LISRTATLEYRSVSLVAAASIVSSGLYRYKAL
jgi:hypothetical protein